MSKYTTEVRFICEEAAGLTESVGYTGVNEVINKALPNVFNFDFPIFDEAYRSILEKKILKHYYTREIGLETVGLWKLFLDTKLNEIMPYYNQLYKSQLIEFNPMYDVDLTRDHTLKRLEDVKENGTLDADISRNGTTDTSNTENRTGSSDTKGTKKEDTTNDLRESVTGETTSNTDINNTNGNTSDANVTRNHTDKYAETPQGGLEGLTNDTYLTNARITADTDTNKTTVSGTDESHGVNTTDSSTDTDSTTEINVSGTTTETTTTNQDSTATGKTTNTDSENRNQTQSNTKNLNSIDDYIEHVTGKNGGASYSSLLKEFRETFLNIDLLIIDELSDLFFNLW